MPGPGAYWFGKEEMEAVIEVMKGGYLFRYGSENDPKFLHKVSTLEKEFARYCGINLHWQLPQEHLHCSLLY